MTIRKRSNALGRCPVDGSLLARLGIDDDGAAVFLNSTEALVVLAFVEANERRVGLIVVDDGVVGSRRGLLLAQFDRTVRRQVERGEFVDGAGPPYLVRGQRRDQARVGALKFCNVLRPLDHQGGIAGQLDAFVPYFTVNFGDLASEPGYQTKLSDVGRVGDFARLRVEVVAPFENPRVDRSILALA